MNPKFLEILCCPKTGEGLQLKVDETSGDGFVVTGTLIAERSGHAYPIVRAIPRFIDAEHYTDSFGYEWQKWSRVQFEAENVGGKMQGHTKRMFEIITGFSEQDLKGRRVVEFGCGPGRFLDLVRGCGGSAVGIDMSMAVESARVNFKADPEVLIVQGDILNPPFKPGVFDVGYSIGVLHHTPAPEEGLKKLARVVKSGGLVGCCVYPREGLYNYPSVFRFRKLHRMTSHLLGTKGALAYSYFSAYFLYHVFDLLRRTSLTQRAAEYVEKNLVVNVDVPDARWRVLDVFDAITPAYASTHTPEEVTSWFEQANCSNLCRRPWGTAAFVGIKGGD